MMINLGVRLNLVSVRYPRRIGNQTLSASVRISNIRGDLMRLEDGRSIRLDQGRQTESESERRRRSYSGEQP